MKCFYHNDMDGRCAGFLIKKWYEEKYNTKCNKEDFFEVDYVQEIPNNIVEDGELVIFVDYSFTENTVGVLNELRERADLIWIDHHKSSIELCAKLNIKNIEGIIDSSLCGAALVYKWIHNGTEGMPQYIKFVDDYDRWIYKYKDNTSFFKLGLETFEFDVFDDIWERLYKDSFGVTLELINKGKLIKSYIDKDNKLYLDNFGYETEIQGLKCLAVNKKSNSWIFGDKYEKYPICMTYAFNGSEYVYSIFSVHKSVDCAKIAQMYGGGGHKGAAGFKSKKILFGKISDKLEVEQSKLWSMMYTAEDVMNMYDTVLLNTKYHGHSSDDGFGGFAIYIKHANDSGNYHIITITHDGLVYDGDAYLNEDGFKYLVELPTKKAYKYLCQWRDLVVAGENLESSLIGVKEIENNCISIILNTGHTK